MSNADFTILVLGSFMLGIVIGLSIIVNRKDKCKAPIEKEKQSNNNVDIKNASHIASIKNKIQALVDCENYEQAAIEHKKLTQLLYEES